MSPASTLSQRVQPLPPFQPHHELVAQWRPATAADVDDLMRLYAAADPIDHPEYATLREEVEDNFEVEWLNPATDTMMAVSATGEVLAYGIAMRAAVFETQVNVYLLGTVRPDVRRRGIGSELFAWQVARGTQILAGIDLELPGWLATYQRQASEDARKLAESHGLRAARFFTEMHLEIADAPPSLPVPDGIQIVPYDSSFSRSTMQARNEAFRDHWGSQPVNETRWKQLVEGEAFRPDLSRLAIATDSGDVVGMVLASYNEDDVQLSGVKASYIDSVGVIRSWRGRGVAKALLSATIEASRAAGMQAVDLDVDAESPTGANALYESLGFHGKPGEVGLVKVF